MRSWQGLVAIAGGAVLILGLAWGGLLWDRDPGAVPTPTPDSRRGGGGQEPTALSAEIAALGAALAEEREARRALAREVQWLREELERLSVIPPVDPPPPEEAPPSFHGHEGKLRFDESGLLAEGVPVDVATRLRQRFDESRMDELYLRDEAAREGWLRTPRYREELRDLRVGLREEIGDEDYDLMLFATERHNRVIVSDVLQGSPALQAGFQAGDVVYSYDGRRTFDRSELLTATTEGKAGATVAIDVRRDGERLRFYLPRGPIGIAMEPAKVAPQGSR
ncbi:MAG: PDZ domain-containing protein [Planctomycetota bacterium]|jgi:hypothetical protein